MNDSPNEADENTGAAPRSQSNPMIAIVIGVSVAVFGVFVAIGSYFSDETPDWRKPLIVLAAIGGFLGMWAIAWRFKRR